MPHRTAQVQFDTLAIEGGLFTAEWLGKVAALDAPAQGEADYGVRAGFTLREEIALAWRAAQALWAQFEKARQIQGHDVAGVTRHFAVELLRQAFSFSLRAEVAAESVDGRSFPIGHFALERTVPVIIGGHALPLDAADPRFGDASGERLRRRSAFGLLQEYLNAKSGAHWGIATNGLALRIARDNASLTRPAWFETDLERLFTEERLAEFSVLWLMAHATRFGGTGVAPSECVLERWHDACRDQGMRARETLRGGVEEALLVLGNGFLAHPANTALRETLAHGRQETREFFQQLLRLVYRLIFLLTVEERGVLQRDDSAPGARKLYTEGYSLRRLRDRAVRRNAHDRHHDLWEGLKLIWIGLARGEPRLALPTLGGLFAEDQCRDLDAARLENRHLLRALFHLAWLRDKDQPNAPLARVNWRDMGPEELGSIYESLLELVPQIGDGNRGFSFLEGEETRGHARKTSGSYYTPDSLVQLLLDSALEPVIAERLAAHPSGEPAIEALLSITVVDPACGSGHFLLAAARRIATHLARVLAEQQGIGQPTPSDYRQALRKVVAHCIFGVDINPMALELARTAFWLEAFTPDAPLGFIDHHLACGNALVGVMDPKVLLEGIPDQAYKPLTGDDPEVCKALRATNRAQRGALEKLMREGPQRQLALEAGTAATRLAEIDALPDDTLEAIETKRKRYAALHSGALDQLVSRQHLLTACNLYVTAFLLRKTKADGVPTTQHVINALLGQPIGGMGEAAWINAAMNSVLHWPIAFAQVFAKAGFSCVLGNPPWEVSQLSEEEYFASEAPEIASLKGAARKRAIAGLRTSNIHLWERFQEEKRATDATNSFLNATDRFALSARGRLNSYALFVETAMQAVAPGGRAGLIVPTGLLSDENTAALFRALIQDARLVSALCFENEEFIFPGIANVVRFSLLTISPSRSDPASCRSKLAFYLRRADHLHQAARLVSLGISDFAAVNPNSLTSPIYRTQADADLTRSLYERIRPLWIEGKDAGRNEWCLEFRQGLFNMSSDSALFRERRDFSGSLVRARDGSVLDGHDEWVPLYEAKYIWHYDHRFGSYHNLGVAKGRGGRGLPPVAESEHRDPTFLVTPRYFVPEKEVAKAVEKLNWARRWFLVWRDVTSAKLERTCVFAAIPFSGAGHTLQIVLSPMQGGLLAALCANLNSLVLDFVARQKIGGSHASPFYLKQLPVLSPSDYSPSDLAFIVPRVLELTYTADDLKAFHDDLITENPAWDSRLPVARGVPFSWDPDRRQLLCAELDAYFAKRYSLTRDELRYILDPADVMGADYPSETFRVLRKNEIDQYGEYRTRRLVLEAWDRLESVGQLPVSRDEPVLQSGR